MAPELRLKATVIPAQAGIQMTIAVAFLDSGLRRNDDLVRARYQTSPRM